MRRILGILLILFALTVPLYAQENQVTHTVQSGENLFRIALRYGVDMNSLAQANGITDLTKVYAGQVLIIPGLSQPTTGTEVTNPLVAATPLTHTVQRGETLGTIAQRYGVTMQSILDANNIPNANRILTGQQLQIWAADGTTITMPAEPVPATPAPVVEVAPTTGSVTHVVKSGEYLFSIARQYGLSWTVIAEANNLQNPNQIYAGMELRIPDASQYVQTGIMVTSESNAPAAHIGTGREIVVDLSTQMTYAYENGIVVKSALSSTGLPATPTVQGQYSVYLKYDSQTMSGPGYYLPGVQWVMYFYQGYALHGTYWHNNFGNPMSHGCVNLTNDDAKWFYDFAVVGTPVFVQW